jgi:hypothetical protein
VAVNTESFVDALGRRYRATDADGGSIEIFRLCPEVSGIATTQAALVERANRLAAFAHSGFATVRRVERTVDGLAIVSTAVPGIRLSDVVRHASERGIVPSPGAVRGLMWQVLSAMADFHHHAPDLAHGALSPERIVVGPDGRATIVEHLLAPVFEQLRLGRTALWSAFQVPVPSGAGGARFDQMTDVLQLGMVALALVLGRPIGREEYPHQVDRLLADASSPAIAGHQQLGSKAMRAWLLRAFQVQARSSFRTAGEAAVAFENVLADEPRHRSSAAAVLAFVEAAMPSASEPLRTSDKQGGHRIESSPSVRPSVAAKNAAEIGRQPVVMRGPERAPAFPTAPAGPGRAVPPPSHERKSMWAAIRRRAAVAAMSLGLVTLFGVAYLGASGHAIWPVTRFGRHVAAEQAGNAGATPDIDRARPPKSPAFVPSVLPAHRHPQ